MSERVRERFTAGVYCNDATLNSTLNAWQQMATDLCCYRTATRPPSMVITVPLMNAASSEARKTTAPR